MEGNDQLSRFLLRISTARFRKTALPWARSLICFRLRHSPARGVLADFFVLLWFLFNEL